MSRRVYSVDQEMFNYDSISEAAIDMADVHWPDPLAVGDIVTIYEGKVIESVASDYSPNYLIDTLAENAYDECGEFADDWLSGLDNKCKNDLINRVHKVIDDWATEHNVQPTFYMVEDIVEIEIRFTNAEGDWELV